MDKFRSLGLDNAILSAVIHRRHADRLLRAFPYVVEDVRGTEWHVIVPDILFIRIHTIRLFVSMNIPKLSGTGERHNVLLAWHKEVTKAISIAANMLSIDRTILSRSVVESVHVTYTGEEVDGFHYRPFIQNPKGYVIAEQENGVYVNSLQRIQTFLAYSKDGHLESRSERIPKSVQRKLTLDDPTLVRFELRLEKLVYRQLKRAGVWTLNSFTGQDLESASGLFALTRFFEKRLPQFIRVRKVRKSTEITRSFADREPASYLKFISEQWALGIISQTKFERESLRAEMLINHYNVISLLESVKATSDKLNAPFVTRIFTPTIGELSKPELLAYIEEQNDATSKSDDGSKLRKPAKCA